jgi:hypothetical protein
MILLFTTLAPDRPLYKRDLLNVCCEPVGAAITFGYKTKWIAENLRSASSLQDKIAAIIFCEHAEGASFTYHPLRSARISAVRTEYEALTLDLELGGFFNYERDKKQIDDVIHRFQEYVRSSDARPDVSLRSEDRRYVRWESDWDASDWSGTWLSLVNHIRRRVGVEDATFIGTDSSSAADAGPGALLPQCRYESGRAIHRVLGGSSHEITLRVISPKGEYLLPELTIKDTVASVSGPFVRQRSADVEATFVLTFKRSFEAETSMLMVRVPPGAPNTLRSPELRAEVHVDIRHSTLYAAIALLVLGSLLESIDFKDPWRTSAIKVGGAALLAIGAYIGFRKLPIKP